MPRDAPPNGSAQDGAPDGPWSRVAQAAAAGRFADGDLAAILAHQASAADGEQSRATEQSSLAQGTGGWARHSGQEAAR